MSHHDSVGGGQGNSPDQIVTPQFKALWKTRDFEDTLYTFGASIAASISERTQLRFEVLGTYKNKPRLATTSKNDVAVLMAIVYKM